MPRPISGDYRLGRRLVTGALDPSGLELAFSLDNNRVYCHVEATPSLVGKARVVPPGVVMAVVDDLAHASVAALRKRVGVTRETRVRFLKPAYAGDTLRADGLLVGEVNGLFTVGIRILNHKEQLCIEVETEIFALTAEQVRRMTPDGMIPFELKRYFPS